MAEQKKMDTKFSVALHILAMISESQRTLNSNLLAQSVGTNASYIRKILALLKKADLVASQQGRSGYRLTRPTKSIQLLEIYRATQEIEQVSIFDLHQHSNADCPVGRYVDQALTPTFRKVEEVFEQELAKQTLGDFIDRLYQARAEQSI